MVAKKPSTETGRFCLVEREGGVSTVRGTLLRRLTPLGSRTNERIRSGCRSAHSVMSGPAGSTAVCGRFLPIIYTLACNLRLKYNGEKHTRRKSTQTHTHTQSINDT